jgi:GNAT superfamily N-acetyltransferase
VEVSEVGRGDLDTFLRTLALGFGTAEGALDAIVANQQFWIDVPSWRLLLARIDGEPAGAAVLDVSDPIAYLAAGTTLPRFQRRGVHWALIAARIELALEADCSMVTGQARFASTSQRNQQRAGLRLFTIRQTWTRA